MADREKQSIQEYNQRNSVMKGIGCSQGIQYERGQTYSTTTHSMFEERRAQLYQYWNKEGFSSSDQALLMCEIVDPSTSRSTRVAYAEAIKTKNDRENRNRDYEGQIK